MAAVEAVLDLVDQRSRAPVEAVERDVDLENLLAVTHFRGAFRRHRPAEPGAQPAGALKLQFGKQVSRLVRRDARTGAVVGAADLVAQIAGQHAPGRQHRGRDRHDHALDVEFARDLGGMQAGRAAKTQQREFSGIDAAAQGHQPDAVGHLQVDHPENAGGGFDPLEVQRCGHPVDGGFGRRTRRAAARRP